MTATRPSHPYVAVWAASGTQAALSYIVGDGTMESLVVRAASGFVILEGWLVFNFGTGVTRPPLERCSLEVDNDARRE